MLRKHLFIASLLLCVTSVNAGTGSKQQAGYIPNAQVAVEVTRAIAMPIYGAENIKRQEPLKAILVDEVWVVTGTLEKGEGVKGGVVMVKLAKKDARVMLVTHGK